MGKRRAKQVFPQPDFVWEVPLYGGSVYVYCDRRRYDKARQMMTGETEDQGLAYGMSTHLQSSCGERIYLLGWFSGQATTLVHEALHVALFICESVGIDPSSGQGEPLAYLLDSIFEDVYLALQDHQWPGQQED